MPRKVIAVLLPLLVLPAFLPTAWAEEEAVGGFEAKPLDGVMVEAVETYANPRKNELGINPQKIVHLKSSFSTDLAYIFSYGKLILFNKYIRSFRTALMLGGGA